MTAINGQGMFAGGDHRRGRRTAMYPAGAQGLKPCDHPSTPGENRQRHANPLASEDPTINSGTCRPCQAGVPPPPAIGRLARGLPAQNSERLGIVDDEAAVVGMHQPEVLIEWRRLPGCRTEAIGHHHRSQTRAPVSYQPLFQGRRVMHRKGSRRHTPGCRPLHAPAGDRVGARVHKDRDTFRASTPNRSRKICRVEVPRVARSQPIRRARSRADDLRPGGSSSAAGRPVVSAAQGCRVW